MTKDNVLFGIVGLLAGLIIGFMFANSVNKGALAATTTAATTQTGTLPPGHPDVPPGSTGGSGAQSQMGASVPEVQAAIEKAKAEPNNFDAQVKAAEFYYQIQRFDGAIEFLKKANELQPENYDVLVQLGNANFDADRYEVAEKWYEAALTKKPDQADVRTDYGLTFMFRDKPDYDRAISEFNRALAIDPNHEQTLQNLVVAYTKKGDGARAKASLEKLSKINPSNSSISKLNEDIGKISAK
ncbi:MAG TPA: tetratricopeptide repeat protein [Pyrinomonadaceae bacterium]|nr:tetratricopeptide repeat protein [Pyrinomonadaceae bacterium]